MVITCLIIEALGRAASERLVKLVEPSRWTSCGPCSNALYTIITAFCMWRITLVTVFFFYLDMLHLWGTGTWEQSCYWSLHDMQQTWLPTGLSCHMVSCRALIFQLYILVSMLMSLIMSSVKWIGIEMLNTADFPLIDLRPL